VEKRKQKPNADEDVGKDDTYKSLVGKFNHFGNLNKVSSK
jgi:hypothetical protein